jgi:hypothetical protein
MFVNVNIGIYKLFHSEFVGLFMICLYAEYYASQSIIHCCVTKVISRSTT